MTRARRIAAVFFCAAATVYAVPATFTAADSMLTWVKPTVEEPWSGGKVWSVDTEFLDWVRERIPDGDHFMVIDGTGNVAIGQWTPFQLYPAVVTEDADEADWVVLYGIDAVGAGPEVEGFPEEQVYSDGFSLLGREGSTDDSGAADDGS